MRVNKNNIKNKKNNMSILPPKLDLARFYFEMDILWPAK